MDIQLPDIIGEYSFKNIMNPTVVVSSSVIRKHSRCYHHIPSFNPFTSTTTAITTTATSHVIKSWTRPLSCYNKNQWYFIRCASGSSTSSSNYSPDSVTVRSPFLTICSSILDFQFTLGAFFALSSDHVTLLILWWGCQCYFVVFRVGFGIVFFVYCHTHTHTIVFRWSSV
jgi:hypothetical protein